MVDEWRVQFDADVTFLNGGGLQAQDFRLDIPGSDITDQDLAAMFIRSLGLLMVDKVEFKNRQLLREPHKGSRGSGVVRPPRSALRFIELSHAIKDGMVTYPGLPAPEISGHITREDSRKFYSAGCEFHIGRINMVSNTGTYLDTPYHRYADGADLAGFPLQSMADIEGIVLRVTGSPSRAIDRSLFLPLDVQGKAVLVHTGWDRHWGSSKYGAGHPFLTADAAQWLAEQGAKLVGIDSLNIDDTGDGTRPVHSILLASGIPIVEHLTGLDGLPVEGFRFFATPPRVEGMGTFPVRAFATIS